MQSSLFLRNLTCVDHAWIDENGNVVGGSVHASVVVRGPVEEQEQVVVDFSKVKKEIKAIIDDQEVGLDHKLWVIEDISKCTYTEEEGRVHIKTPKLEINCPSNAVAFIFDPVQYLEQLLSANLSKNHGVEIQCFVDFTENGFTENGAYFRYWHGLKNSSSWGCKNICHGHLSFIEATSTSKYGADLYTKYIANALENALFIHDENIISVADDLITVGYDSNGRGWFEIRFNPNEVSHAILSTETTIENLVEYIWNSTEELREQNGITAIYVSEGLQKGAVKTS